MKKNAAENPQFDPIQRLNEVGGNIQIPSGVELQIRRIIHRDSVQKGEVLVEMNTVCDRIWFIGSGLFRSYKKVKGREENTWFMQANDLMTDPKSFHTGQPSKHTILAMEDSIVYSIARHQIYDLCRKSHDFEHICHLLTWEYYTKFMDYWDELTSGTVKQRYNRFLLLFPGLDDRESVAVRDIASLLKCSVRSLHRVKTS